VSAGDVLSRAGGLVVLVDPGRTTPESAEELARRAEDAGCAAVMIGTSFGGQGHSASIVQAIKRATPTLPLIQFPGAAAQLVAGIDAVLFLSLVSGRNAQYLIEEHVRAVPFFERHPEIEVISTAYCLIDGGRVTSVESVSQTRPLPADKPELVTAHVRAAAMIGMRAVYLDAGSGADRPVAPSLVRAARDATAAPLFVGGGLRDVRAVRTARDAGADYVIIGTLFEDRGPRGVRDLALAARA
jgi:phosphoglycerol geranylgeranyltransferase